MASLMAGFTSLARENAEFVLPVALVVAAIAGGITGAFYRAGTAVVASFVTIIAIGVIGAGEGWAFWRIAFVAFTLLTALQAGYVLGAALNLWGEQVLSTLRDWRRIVVMGTDGRGENIREPPEA